MCVCVCFAFPISLCPTVWRLFIATRFFGLPFLFHNMEKSLNEQTNICTLSFSLSLLSHLRTLMIKHQNMNITFLEWRTDVLVCVLFMNIFLVYAMIIYVLGLYIQISLYISLIVVHGF